MGKYRVGKIKHSQIDASMDNDFIERRVFSLSFRYHYHVGFRGDSPRRKAWEVEARRPRDLFLSCVFSSRRYYAISSRHASRLSLRRSLRFCLSRVQELISRLEIRK